MGKGIPGTVYSTELKTRACRQITGVELPKIKVAVSELSGGEAEFRMTIVAVEYFETRRLRTEKTAA